MSATSESNARSVVAAWRAGNHVAVWDEPALNMMPSEVNRLIAGAWDDIRRTIDTVADGLGNQGFQPGLPLMRELRGLASTAAHRAQRAHSWANDLRDAELAVRAEVTPPECTCPFRWTTHYRSCPLYVHNADCLPDCSCRSVRAEATP